MFKTDRRKDRDMSQLADRQFVKKKSMETIPDIKEALQMHDEIHKIVQISVIYDGDGAVFHHQQLSSQTCHL